MSFPFSTSLFLSYLKCSIYIFLLTVFPVPIFAQSFNSDAINYFLMAKKLEEQGKKSEAILEYQKATLADPSFREAYIYHGSLLLE